MILHALKEYYDRVAADPDSEIAPEGFERKSLEFLIVISENGDFVGIEDTREIVGKKPIAKVFLLPRSKGRSGAKAYATTFLLWDHIGYLLGQPISDEKSQKQHSTWLKALEDMPDELADDIGVKAMRRFYSSGGVYKAIACDEFKDCLKATSCNMAFRLQTDSYPVPCRPSVQNYVSKSLSEDKEASDDVATKNGVCIVTGESGEIARTHGRTPINKDTKCLIGFQKNSGYDSYGKEQGFNAPIIKSTEFAYVTGLNTLLKSKSQRLNVGDVATVFWAAKRTKFESEFSFFFSGPPTDNPAEGTQKIRELFASFKNGVYVEDDKDTDFYILGLSPNAARISVRFWHHGKIAEFASHIRQHFEDLEIVKPAYEPAFYSLFKLLANVCLQDKIDNLPPKLAGDFIQTILNGSPYPSTLLQAALRRIRCNGKDNKGNSKERVNGARAALIKSYLNRYQRIYDKKQKELSMALDIDQPSIGYQLGRLFATLAKIQDEAQPGINATIRERFYGAACASPVTVFANLLKLMKHHLAKLPKGRAITFEKLVGEIMSHLSDFPAHLDLHEQGRFAIGYYHQWQDFFTKADTKETSEKTLEAGAN